MAPPIYKTKNGQFSVAIFENEKGNSVALQKSFTDKEGNWKNQGLSVFPKDIDRVIGLLEEAKKQCEAPEGAASSSEIDEEIIIEEEEVFDVTDDPSEMREFIEEDEMSALDIWNRCDDIEEEEEEIDSQLNLQDFPMKEWI